MYSQEKAAKVKASSKPMPRHQCRRYRSVIGFKGQATAGMAGRHTVKVGSMDDSFFLFNNSAKAKNHLDGPYL